MMPSSPQTETKEDLSLRAQLSAEWHHLRTLPLARQMGLLLPSLLLFFVAPPLPIAAYALQHWAASSHTWPDRWASIIHLIKISGWIFGFLLLYLLLERGQVWFVPTLTAVMQDGWRVLHLPGELSLSLFDARTLFVRSLLSFLFVPALAWFYELVDPRCPRVHDRYLTATDIGQAKPKATEAPTNAAAPDALPKQQPVSGVARKTKTKKQRASEKASPPIQTPSQMTIESFLSEAARLSETPPQNPPLAKQQPAQPGAPKTPTPPKTEPKSSSSTINWDDIAQ